MIWSPSTTLPSRVDREAAVGVAVVGDADVGAVRARRARRAESRCVEPTPSLMFRPSGSAPMTVTRAPASRNVSGETPDAAPCAQSSTTCSPSRRCGSDAEQVHDVAVLGIGEPADAADAGAGGLQLRAGHRLLDALLDHVGELDAAAGEDLDAVVGRRVVRCRDHHAEVGVDVGDQVRGGGRRQDAGVEHVDAGGGEPRRDGGGEELARDARVARDDGGEALAGGLARLGGTALAQDDGSRLGQGECEIGGEGAVGQPPHPVRAEERHRSGEPISASSTEEPCGPS